MRSSLLSALVVILVCVFGCVLFILYRVGSRVAEERWTLPTFAFDQQIHAPYGNLVRSTLEWLDSYHLPIGGLARTVFNCLMAVLLGGAVSPGADHPLPGTSNHQTQDIVVQMDIQSPPPAYY